MFAVRFAQGVGRHFRQTNAADFSSTYQVSQGAHTLFDGHAFVPAVQVIQVNHIGVETAQTVVAGGFDGVGSSINDPHFFAIPVDIHTLHAAFAGQGETAAVLR